MFCLASRVVKILIRRPSHGYIRPTLTTIFFSNESEAIFFPPPSTLILLPAPSDAERNPVKPDTKHFLTTRIDAAHADPDSGTPETLYDGHIPTSFLQKALLTVGSAAMALVDPRRDDMVAVLGETTGSVALGKMWTRMSQDPEGSAILSEMPRINSSTVDFDYLASKPDNSLAGTYLQFLKRNKVTPDSRLPVQFVDDPELAYVMQRYREVHDMIHVVLGMPTNMLGEVAVKWVEAIQTGLPMCIGAAVFGPVRLSKKQRQLYTDSYLPWAIKCGRESHYLMNIFYERHWDEPIDELRQRLNIPPLK